MKKQIAIYVTVVIIIAGIIFGGFTIYKTMTTPVAKTVETQQVKPQLVNKTLTYKGQEGITALTLLEQNATIKSSGTGTSAFVTSIDGLEANSANEFWSFKINETMAEVGAGSYITKDSDTITWELSSF